MKNRKRNRLKGYDYSRDNLYFVTVCVQDRLCCFGEVIDVGQGIARELSVREEIPAKCIMKLNVYGLIVQERLLWLQEQYPYVVIDNFVVMPNHVHAIIEIDRLRIPVVGIKIKSLSSLMGAFKTTSSKLIHEIGFLDFSWQRSFHYHINKTKIAYQNISNYIDF
ncbi:hypothetical protein BZARG_3019 [Bizionia argentinensis JUB59]|uniref:Transposase IS200-like domain-containing protein n=1 Tax=Bizionia argentinensis JUB59 TaxID=1046627 RepID=G2EFZ9_9FLAO|nr:transposase [Bizionia argentinensis]EGV42641.1 hypothetical protein BZARG_3019 [Bizionia argentinensis JUB59]